MSTEEKPKQSPELEKLLQRKAETPLSANRQAIPSRPFDGDEQHQTNGKRKEAPSFLDR